MEERWTEGWTETQTDGQTDPNKPRQTFQSWLGSNKTFA